MSVEHSLRAGAQLAVAYRLVLRCGSPVPYAKKKNYYFTIRRKISLDDILSVMLVEIRNPRTGYRSRFKLEMRTMYTRENHIFLIDFTTSDIKIVIKRKMIAMTTSYEPDSTKLTKGTGQRWPIDVTIY